MIQLINSTSKDTDPGHLTEYNEYTRMWVLEEKTAQFFVAQYKFRSVQNLCCDIPVHWLANKDP